MRSARPSAERQAVLADHQHARQGQGDPRRPGATTRARPAPATAPTWSRTRWWTRWWPPCVADYPRLAHRYYALKAKWLGLAKLQHWDRNAPLPDDDDRQIAVAGGARAGARRLRARSSPNWPTSAGASSSSPGSTRRCTPGKAGGAFAHPTVPSRASLSAAELPRPHPRRDDAGARAWPRRASGAGGRAQGYLMSGTPLTLAETASVFGEMLTFRALLDAETRPAPAAHHARRQGGGHAEHGGAPDRLLSLRDAAARRAPSRASCCRSGSASCGCRCRPKAWARRSSSPLNTTCFWAYVPHFIHSPFYVYAYAFGDCLVNALYARLPRPGIRGSRRSTSTCCGPAGRGGTASCWRRSGWTPRIRPSGSAAST